jgi:hypothetical protein
MKKLLLFSAFAVIIQTLSAQEQAEFKSPNTGGFLISVGPSFPMGDFGDDDDDDEDALGAGTGIALNFDYILPLSDNGLGLFFGAGINYNGLKSDLKDDIEDDYRDEGIDDDDITFPKYFNIPVSAGLNFTHNFDEKIGLYGNLGLVANFLKITDFEVESDYGDVALTYTARTNLGLRVGGGLIINNKFYISLNYIDAGKTKIDYEFDYEDEPFYNDEYSNKSKISYLNLLVGIKL